ncbi:hypothetical protein POM88_047822 [Heracleum sosnowskyi]|uniref:Uncharacterized protein n=1 Tax=Heracleum sosnowskyi TaxID=360622 RepID=A0AAD8GV30_9APIA|nr:hypothetical protein POM88_047822 [Heracleum sosnowskyi]
MTLNEITPGLREQLPPTDSRLRPDQRCLENGEFEMANSEKLRLEQRQRQNAGNRTGESLGVMLLKARSLFPETYWYWIGVGALLGYTVLFNILYTLFLTYLNLSSVHSNTTLGNQQVVICDKEAEVGSSRMQGECDVIELREYLQHSHSFSEFDVIRDTRVGNMYLVIDINYFPGYAKMPGYEKVLTDFFCDVFNKKQSGHFDGQLGMNGEKEVGILVGNNELVGDEDGLPVSPLKMEEENGNQIHASENGRGKW